jgi:hypothetical protein
MRTIAAIAMTLILVACGGNAEKDKPDESLRNADDVKASETAAATTTVEIGEFAPLSDGAEEVGRVSVTKLKVGGDDLGPWLEASVRFENTTDEEGNLAEVGIWCKGATESGGWQADSTLDLNATIPAKSYKEGVVNLPLSDDPRTGEPVPECETPAFIQFTPLVTVGDVEPVQVRIPNDLIAKLNDKRVR